MPKVSFVLPVYNMERYLSRAAESLKAQTLTDFEAIFVNDGSKDSSGAMCAALAAEDSRFVCIDQPNGGVAKARNAALAAASGEYICFLDPDDWVEPNTAEELYTAAKKEDADIVLYGIQKDVYDTDGKLVQTSISHPPLSGVFRGEPFKEHFNLLASSFLVIGKFMRREYLEKYQLRFPDKRLGEDGLFYVEFYRHDPACVVGLDKPLYHYTLARSASLSNSYHPERLKDNFYLSEAVWNVVEEWGFQDNPMHLQKAQYCTVRDLQMGIKNISISPLSFGERRAWLADAAKQPRVAEAVSKTPLNSMNDRNDRIKLALLKCHLYGMVVLLSSANRNKKR